MKNRFDAIVVGARHLWPVGRLIPNRSHNARKGPLASRANRTNSIVQSIIGTSRNSMGASFALQHAKQCANRVPIGM